MVDLLSDTSGLVKAYLKNLDASGGDKIELMFNPPEYGATRSVKWVEAPVKGQSTTVLMYMGVKENDDLTLRLVFDTTRTHEDVSESTKKITALSTVDTDLHRPPRVEFGYGNIKFVGVVTSMDQTFTRFNKSGTPLRAEMDLTLKRHEGGFLGEDNMEGGSTSDTELNSPDHTKVHVVTQGETLDLIAAREYEDTRYWKLIAEANDLEDPARLVPGQRLALPRLF